jgi:hypothetical protein
MKNRIAAWAASGFVRNTPEPPQKRRAFFSFDLLAGLNSKTVPVTLRHRISSIDTNAIEIEKTGGRILSFTLPERCSVPAEFKVGDEVIMAVYQAHPQFLKTSYCEIKHLASEKVIKVFYKI